MAEGYINLFDNDHAGTNRPHFKGLFKIDGVDHEFALWPAKDGKKGYSGKYKPKQPKSDTAVSETDKAFAELEKKMGEKP